MIDDETTPDETGTDGEAVGQPTDTPAGTDGEAVGQPVVEEAPAEEPAMIESPDDTPGDDAASGDEPAPAPPIASEDADADAAAEPDAADAAAEPDAADAAAEPDAAEATADPDAAAEPEAEEFLEETPRVKPAIPGADLEVDIVPEGCDPLTGETRTSYSEDGEPDEGGGEAGDGDEPVDQPLTAVTINLGADARYRATGKRKTAIARVILKPGTGAYTINGKPLDEYFPRPTLQKNIRQPLETVGYEEKMDVVAKIHGGGVAAQAGALRHGVSRALLEADPNLRIELKRRGFLTRDARVKERKKAGLKKARKRPQFSKR